MKYEYYCKTDGVVEEEHSMAEEAHTVCPICGSTDYRRMIHSVPVVYKARGFVTTDMRAYKSFQTARQKNQKVIDDNKKWTPPTGVHHAAPGEG